MPWISKPPNESRMTGRAPFSLRPLRTTSRGSRARRRLLAAYVMNPKNEEILPLLKESRVGILHRLFLIPRLLRAKKRKSNWC